MKFYILLFLSALIFFSCSQSPLEEGDAALKSGEYGKAIRSYNEALKATPSDNTIKEKIARAYFMSGEKIYKLRKVLPALEVRIERGMAALPETISPEMKKYAVKVQLLIADAYMKAKPENDYQKKEYFDKALSYLENAVAMEPADQAASTKLAEFKQNHFDSMLQKGMHYLKRGKSDATNYLTAAYYLEKATDFNPNDAKARDLLRTVRKKTLNILDPTEDLPMAVTAQLYQKGYQAKQIVIQNRSAGAVKISAASFVMLDDKGREIVGEATEIFADALPSKILEPETEITGVVAFKCKKRDKFSKIELRADGNVLSTKYLR